MSFARYKLFLSIEKDKIQISKFVPNEMKMRELYKIHSINFNRLKLCFHIYLTLY